MKRSLFCLGSLLMVVACSSSDPEPKGSGSAGNAGSVASGGAGAAGAPSASSGAPAGGASSGAGTGAGTAGASGAAGGSAGMAGSANAGFSCPTGTLPALQLPTGKAARIPDAPPADDFNRYDFTNVEGPVWIGDALYFSEMTGSNTIPPSRILKIAGGAVSVVVPDSGSNGLAVDGSGNLLAAVHKDGSISQLSLTGGAAIPLVTTYNGARFTSPNDLTLLADGTIYFSDPNYQNSANPQPAQRLYRVTPPPARTVSVIADAPSQPNGVTLSPDQKTLYVSGSGLKKFSVMSDGSLGPASDFVPGSGGDGMAVDCAGNLYVAGGNGNAVRVYSPAGMQLGAIQTDGTGTTTNVAFGGANHQTLYITAQGTEGQRGVHSIALNVPGFPY